MSEDVDYPNKNLVVIGPDGVTTNSQFNSHTHYDQVFNKNDPGSKKVSGSFSPVLNYSQFLTRHAPHPFRVRHMKGLLDNPICYVNDEVPEAQTISKYQRSISTPERAKTYFNGRSTINQMDVSLRLKNPKEFAAPQSQRGTKLNLSDVSGWQTELTKLTQRSLARDEPQHYAIPAPAQKHATHTGRLNQQKMTRTTKSRSMSRGSSVMDLIDSRKEFGMESETLVMDLLSQMLGTNSVTAIQTWLCTATTQEKARVADEVRKVVEKELAARENQQQ